MRAKILPALTLLLLAGCTYDSTPPGDAKINDQKPRLMIDARGFTAQRRVQVQYTDNLATATLQGPDIKTDLSGRFLYTLELARGTRNYTLTVIVDQSGDQAISTGVGDRRYNANGTVAADTEVKTLILTDLADFNNY